MAWSGVVPWAGPAEGDLDLVPRLTPRATTLLAQIEEAISNARFAVASAAQADWVSAAADEYRALLDETARGLVRLESAVAESRVAVLRHTRSSDDASGAAALDHYRVPHTAPVPDAGPAPAPSTSRPRWRAT